MGFSLSSFLKPQQIEELIDVTLTTAGSVVFYDGSGLVENNPNFFWDDGNKRLGIGTDAPDAMLEIVTDATTEEGLKIKGSASQTGSLFLLTDSADAAFLDSGDGLASSEFVINQQGADIDFRVEASGVANALFVQGDTGNIGIGTNAPSTNRKIHVLETESSFLNVKFQNSKAGGSVNFEFEDSANEWTMGVGGGDFKISDTTNSKVLFVIRDDTNTINNFVFIDGDKFSINDVVARYRFATKGSETDGYFGVSNTGDGDIFSIDSSGDVGINTTSPDAKLQVVGDFKVGDDNTNYMEVGTTGDVVFVGGAGLVFGSMYNDNTSTTVTIGTAGTFVRIPSGFTAGQLNGATFGNAREITVTEPGMYKIDWSISFNTASGTNQDIEGAIGIDNANNAQGTAHRFIGTASDIGNMAGTAILDLADNAVVSLMMTNNTNTVNVVVTHASLSLVQVGGT